jgi:hypothetical protein
MAGNGTTLQLLATQQYSNGRERYSSWCWSAPLLRWLATAGPHSAVAMVGSTLQPWPMLHCSILFFLFFTRQLQEKKRMGERKKF